MWHSGLTAECCPVRLCLSMPPPASPPGFPLAYSLCRDLSATASPYNCQMTLPISSYLMKEAFQEKDQASANFVLLLLFWKTIQVQLRACLAALPQDSTFNALNVAQFHHWAVNSSAGMDFLGESTTIFPPTQQHCWGHCLCLGKSQLSSSANPYPNDGCI